MSDETIIKLALIGLCGLLILCAAIVIIVEGIVYRRNERLCLHKCESERTP